MTTLTRLTRAVAAVSIAVALAGATVACTGAAPEAAQPPPGDVLRAAATSTAAVTAAGYALAVDETVTSIPLRSATGRVTSAGEVDGTARLDQAGQLVEVAFVVVGGVLHLQGPTGGYQQLPADTVTSVYDPRRLLDPTTGLAAALTTAAADPAARTSGPEDVDGVPCHRVTGPLDLTGLPGLVPGVTGPTAATWWVTVDGARLARVAVDVPSGGTITLTLTELPEPVTITAPA